MTGEPGETSPHGTYRAADPSGARADAELPSLENARTLTSVPHLEDIPAHARGTGAPPTSGAQRLAQARRPFLLAVRQEHAR